MRLVLLPIAWIGAVAIATAGLPLWHEATNALATSYPALAPLLSNPIQDVMFQFVLPTFVVAVGGAFTLIHAS